MVFDPMRRNRRLAVDPPLQAPQAPLRARSLRVTPVILVIDSEPNSLRQTTRVLESGALDVLALRSVMEAWDMLRVPGQIDLLVTRMHFGAGLPNGLALGRHARSRDPELPVLYTVFAADLATFADLENAAVLPMPISPDRLVRMAWRLVSPHPGLAAS